MNTSTTTTSRTTTLRASVQEAARTFAVSIHQLIEELQATLPDQRTSASYASTRDTLRSFAAGRFGQIVTVPGVTVTTGSVDDESVIVAITGTHHQEIFVELYVGNDSYRAGGNPIGAWRPFVNLDTSMSGLERLAATSFAFEKLTEAGEPADFVTVNEWLKYHIHPAERRRSFIFNY